MDGMTSKEALFALDLDIEDEMDSYADEVTKLAIKYINSTPELYSRVKEANSIEDECRLWAEEHGDEFGLLFITELDQVKWDEVWAMV